jgi:hypothetical protein
MGARSGGKPQAFSVFAISSVSVTAALGESKAVECLRSAINITNQLHVKAHTYTWLPTAAFHFA